MAASAQGNSEAETHFVAVTVAHHLAVAVAVDLGARFASEIAVAVAVQYCSVALLCFVVRHSLQLEIVADLPSGNQYSN